MVRVYTVPGKKNQGKFSLEVGIKALDWYSNWFAIDYPLPKCDLIAIPDFSMGNFAYCSTVGKIKFLVPFFH